MIHEITIINILKGKKTCQVLKSHIGKIYEERIVYDDLSNPLIWYQSLSRCWVTCRCPHKLHALDVRS